MWVLDIKSGIRVCVVKIVEDAWDYGDDARRYYKTLVDDSTILKSKLLSLVDKLKTDSYHDAKFVVTGLIGHCHNHKPLVPSVIKLWTLWLRSALKWSWWNYKKELSWCRCDNFQCHHWRQLWWRHQMEIFYVTGPFWGESTGPADSPHKGQHRWAFMFSLMCGWTNGWANSRDAGDLRRYGSHYYVTVMTLASSWLALWLWSYSSATLFRSVPQIHDTTLAPHASMSYQFRIPGG